MDLCFGGSSLRHPLLRPEVSESLPIGFKNPLCRLCPKAFALECQLFTSAKVLPLSLFPKFSNEPHRGCGDLSSPPGLGVSQFFSMIPGDARCSSGPNEEGFTVADLATGSLDLRGWKVLLRNTKEIVGVVDEIIHIGSVDSDEIFESVLKLVYTSGSQNEDCGNSSVGTEETEENEDLDYLEFLVPLVEDIVTEVDVENNCLFITPPEGLLELARIPQLLKKLEPKLLEFCCHQNDGIRGCLNSVRASTNGRFSDDAKQLLAWRGRSIEERFEIFMPTRRQLMAARRHDLVEDIMAAGGFLAVAQSLKLPSRRRPNGFW